MKTIIIAALLAASMNVNAFEPTKWQCGRISDVTVRYNESVARMLHVSPDQVSFKRAEINSFNNCVVISYVENYGVVESAIPNLIRGNELLADGVGNFYLSNAF
jgi:hypothetical protein